MKHVSLSTIAALLTTAAAHAGTHIWSGAGANSNWSTAANWSSGGAPAAGEAAPVVLIFPDSATKFTSTPNVPNLAVDRIEITQSPAPNDYTFLTSGVTVNLKGTAGDNVVVNGAGPAVAWVPALNLQATCRFRTEAAVSLNLLGIVSGNAGLSKSGDGTIAFSGGGANSFTGLLEQTAGTMEFSKSAGLNCFGGNLSITGSNCYIRNANQIRDAALITIRNAKLIGSIGVTNSAVEETLGHMTLGNGGELRAENSTSIALGGDITVEAGANATVYAVSSSGFKIDGRTCTISTQTGAQLKLAGNTSTISDGAQPGSLLKTGPGTLVLEEDNTLSGTCTIAGGKVRIEHEKALGGETGMNPITVQAGGTLEMGHPDGPIFNMENPAIHLAGTLAASRYTNVLSSVILSGAPALSAASGEILLINHSLSGSANPLGIAGSGTVLFGAPNDPNTYTGDTAITSADARLSLDKSPGVPAVPGNLRFDADGTVECRSANQYSFTSQIISTNGGTFKTGNKDQTISGMSGTGPIGLKTEIGSSTLTIHIPAALQLGTPAAPAAFRGTSSGRVRKLGPGTWTVYHAPASIFENAPDLSPESGTTSLFGSWPGTIEVKGGTLRGGASVNQILGMGGSICLCDFTVSHFSGAANVLMNINGYNAGTSYDRLVVPSSSSSTNLTGQTLNVTMGITPYTGSVFTLIRNGGFGVVTGTFDGLPEGASLTINGLPFRITYAGGPTGRDVELHFTGTGTPPPAITSLVPAKQFLATGISLSMQGTPNHSCILEASPDLVNWTTLSNAINFDEAGQQTYFHGNNGAPRFYYRLRLP